MRIRNLPSAAFTRLLPIGLCAGMALVALGATAEESHDRTLPMQIQNFRFQDTDGDWHELADLTDRKAVVLFVQGNGCPIVRQSFPYFEEIIEEYEPKGVEFLYVNANDYDEPEDIIEEATDFSVSPPIVKDWGQALVHLLHTERTAESFLIDPKTMEIVYRGMADDRFDYGLQRSNPKEFWLKDALDAFLAGEKPKVTKTIAKGCLLDTDLPESSTWKEDVAPVLEARAAGAADMAWIAMPKDKTQAWGPALHEAVLTRQLPGEHPRPLDLTPGEVRKIVKWVQSGMPYESGDRSGD